MKIVYVINSIASKGGAERIIIEKMNYLAEHLGYNVSIICCHQNLSMPNAYPLSEKVNQFFLNVPYYSQYKYVYPYRLWMKVKLNKQLKQGLTKRILIIDPDVLVGVGYFAADIVSLIKCRARKIIEVHEPRLFTMSNQGLGRSVFSKIFMYFYRKYYFRIVEKKADVIVTLSQGDAYDWRRAKHVVVIPNFTQLSPTKGIQECHKRVLSVGRLEWEKGFDRLIRSWRYVANRHPEWCLDIMGVGTLETELNNLIKTFGLEEYVHIHPFTSQINKEYENSYILVSPSRFEGFSLVILEAMKFGVPSVAFNCPYGPKEIIEDGVCGYLVPDGDEKLLSLKICEMIEHPDIRNSFSNAALKQVEKFNVDSVMQKWVSLFETGNL